MEFPWLCSFPGGYGHFCHAFHFEIGNSAQTPSGQDLLHVGHSGCRIGHLEEVADWWANRVIISDPLSVVYAMLGNVTYQVQYVYLKA